MFIYWGRRGLSEFVLELSRAVLRRPGVHAAFSVSRQNDCFQSFLALKSALEPINTFKGAISGLASTSCAGRLCRRLLARIEAERIDTVISLMPHIWGSLVMPAIRSKGIRVVSIVHDATPHAGDLRSWAASWMFRDLSHSDLVITLSEHVAQSIRRLGLIDGSSVCSLFHPDLGEAAVETRIPPRVGGPFRIAFVGRILPYKGLELLVGAVELLRREGRAIELGVFGEGCLKGNATRLGRLEAEVVNRWLTMVEISNALRRYDAVALAHVEASQSGIAALAAGHGLPVISNPVGGLLEQVVEGRTGVLAERAAVPELAAAIARLANSPMLYSSIIHSLAKERENRSMDAFLAALLTCIADRGPEAQRVSAEARPKSQLSRNACAAPTR